MSAPFHSFPLIWQTLRGKGWLASLKASVSAEKIEAYCQFPKELDEERIKAEGLLAEKDIAGRLVSIGKEKVATDSIRQAMRTLKEGLSDEKAAALFKSKSDAAVARKAANDVAQQAFANAPLQGVGEAAWMLMWEQARNYSVANAYPAHEFPVTSDGAHCVLCQQVLTADAASRLKSFESFVTAGLETAAKTKESANAALVAEIVQLPSIEDWISRLAQLQFDELVARSWYESLKSRRAQFVECAAAVDLLRFDWEAIDNALEKRAADLLVEEADLTQLQQDGKRQELETRVRQLKALQWLSENKAGHPSGRQRLASMELLDKAARLTATNALTTKRNELAKTELDAGYQARFAAELKMLGGSRLPVAPQSKAQGRGNHLWTHSCRGSGKSFT